MANEVFRHETLELLDGALKKWMVQGEYRTFLTALRLYVPGMPDDEVAKFRAFMPRRRTTMTKKTGQEPAQTTPLAGCGHDAHTAACCCGVLEGLARVAASIHDQQCCCVEAGDEAGCACCCESLEHVLLAMDAHIKCLRGVCQTTANRLAK